LNVSRAWTERGLQKKDWRWLLGAQSELAILRRSRLGRPTEIQTLSQDWEASVTVDRRGPQWVASETGEQRLPAESTTGEGEVVCTGKSSHEDIEGH
jgi:hypothetical protein